MQMYEKLPLSLSLTLEFLNENIGYAYLCVVKLFTSEFV